MERDSAKKKVARRISRTNNELRVESGSVEGDPTQGVVSRGSWYRVYRDPRRVHTGNSWEDVPDKTRDGFFCTDWNRLRTKHDGSGGCVFAYAPRQAWALGPSDVEEADC